MKDIQPLPQNDPQRPDDHQDQAAEMIRSQINSLYGDQPQPDHQPQAQPVQQPASDTPSQRPDPSQDRAAYEKWYYAQTPEAQQAEWDQYYSQSEPAKTLHVSKTHAVSEDYAHAHIVPKEPQADYFALPNQQTQATPQTQPAQHTAKKPRRKQRNPFRSLLVAMAITLVFSFAFYNEIVIGQVRSYISPSSEISSPIILDPDSNIEVGPEPRIIIPKINVDVPVVYDLGSLQEEDIQEALNDGVVDYEYPGTVQPGQIGNNVIVGHSSNNFLNSGKYKFAFVLLDRLEEGDTFILHYEGQRYVYRIFNKEIIEPTEFDLITQETNKPITTLITCHPPGTSWDRLVVQAEQISPSADSAEAVEVDTSQQPEAAEIVPGNSPSLWSRIF